VQVKINATPNGKGDAVVDDEYFALPEEREMTFRDFIAKKRECSA
jgi:hypothetical protein